MHDQQKRCPHCVTTGSLTLSIQILQSKVTSWDVFFYSSTVGLGCSCAGTEVLWLIIKFSIYSKSCSFSESKWLELELELLSEKISFDSFICISLLMISSCDDSSYNSLTSWAISSNTNSWLHSSIEGEWAS
jgi:hypothetical protein